MRVLHILNTGSYSGAENVVITLIEAYKDDVEGIYCGMQGSIEGVLKEHNITYKPFRKMTNKALRQIISDTKPDIIHAHDFTAGIVSASTGTKIPIINHVHNNSPWIKYYNLKSFLYVISCLWYKKILTVSDSVMNEYVFGKYLKKKTTVVGNPIDTNKIRLLAGEKTDKAYDIAFLGRVSPPKNPYMFLELVKEIKVSHPNLRVVMIGDGELREDVKECIKQEGIDDNVTLLGFQKNPYQYLKQAKLLLMPSSWEGYGLAAVEALALGLPVVCSGAGGLPTIVNDTCGKVCENKQDYINEIVCLLDDQNYMAKKSVGARHRADELDNLNEYKNKVLGIYNEVLRDGA